jgi:hypothetical protein
MIETEEQRRWWFATHPEYSSSNRETKQAGIKEKVSAEKIDPKEVNSYVDNALKYVSGSVADLLKSVKDHFGELLLDDRVNYPLIEPGVSQKLPPFMYNIKRWPDDAFWGFFDWVMQNNPLLMDPNSLERHHKLPQEFVEYFRDCGLGIEDFIIIMRAADHRLKPDGVHTGKGRGGNWNSDWREFIKYHPREDSDERRKEIGDKLDEMVRKYDIDRKAALGPSKRKGR